MRNAMLLRSCNNNTNGKESKSRYAQQKIEGGKRQMHDGKHAKKQDQRN